MLKDDGREKAIIVSQWSSMLYLIRLHLSQYDVKMEIFSGSIPILKRNSIIREFNNTDSGPQVNFSNLMFKEYFTFTLLLIIYPKCFSENIFQYFSNDVLKIYKIQSKYFFLRTASK